MIHNSSSLYLDDQTFHLAIDSFFNPHLFPQLPPPVVGDLSGGNGPKSLLQSSSPVGRNGFPAASLPVGVRKERVE